MFSLSCQQEHPVPQQPTPTLFSGPIARNSLAACWQSPNLLCKISIASEKLLVLNASTPTAEQDGPP